MQTIKRRTLGDILCDNSNLPEVKHNVFQVRSALKPCRFRNYLDLNAF